MNVNEMINEIKINEVKVEEKIDEKN